MCLSLSRHVKNTDIKQKHNKQGFNTPALCLLINVLHPSTCSLVREQGDGLFSHFPMSLALLLLQIVTPSSAPHPSCNGTGLNLASQHNYHMDLLWKRKSCIDMSLPQFLLSQWFPGVMSSSPSLNWRALLWFQLGCCRDTTDTSLQISICSRQVAARAPFHHAPHA